MIAVAFKIFFFVNYKSGREPTPYWWRYYKLNIKIQLELTVQKSNNNTRIHNTTGE